MASGNDPEEAGLILREGEDWYSTWEVAEMEEVSERTITDRVSNEYYRSEKLGKLRFIAYRIPTSGIFAGRIPEWRQKKSGRLLEKFQKPPEDFQIIPAVIPEDSGKIEELREENYELKSNNFKLKTLLELAEIKNSEQKENFEILLKEKDELITVLKDQVSQDKEHIKAEKKLAEMASIQLTNANALIKRREDSPAEVTENPEIKAIKKELEELRQKDKDDEAVQAKLDELQAQNAKLKERKPWEFWK
jgi:hypothetical protein